MIVKNQEWSLEHASKIAGKLTDIITQEIKDFKGEDDASEIIYILGHATANFFSRMCLYFDDIGTTYGIDMSKSKPWMLEIVEALVKSNSGEVK